MDVVKQLINSLTSMFAPHLTPSKSNKKLKAEDNLHTKLMKLLNNPSTDLKQLYQDIENAVKNARIKDKLANRIMKKASVLIIT